MSKQDLGREAVTIDHYIAATQELYGHIAADKITGRAIERSGYTLPGSAPVLPLARAQGAPEAWRVGSGLLGISTAPKDRPVLAWCSHEADPYVADEGDGRLTLYAAHYEGTSHAPTGWHIVEWGGGFADCVDDGGACLPDWWFVAGSEFEVAANPVFWCDLPPEPVAAGHKPIHASDCALHMGPAYTPGPCNCGAEPVAPPPEPAKAEVVDAALWCAHVRGPDDVAAAASYDDAVALCDQINAIAKAYAHLDVMVVAYPALWPWDAQSHAANLAKGNGYRGPTLATTPTAPAAARSAAEAKMHAVNLEQCSIFVESEPIKRAMTDAAAFIRASLPGEEA